MTEAKAIDTDKIEATFASDVPADTEITVTKDGANIDGTATKEGAKATFVSKSKFAVGTYTITAKLGDATVSKEVIVTTEQVSEIKITSTQALLKADGTKRTAIVYYDVYNQYGTSMRSSTSVTWTASSGTVKANKATGRLEVTKTGDEFTYGQKLYLVGVDAKSGKTAQAEVSIGLEQAVDSVEFVGFLNTKGDTSKVVENLPSDFPPETYVMLYATKDQDGQIMDASTENITSASGAALTFTSDNPMVLDGSKIKDGSIYTIDGVEYSSAKMEPGMYADQGGEVNLMVIANKTGKQSTINFIVGSAGRLKTFTISAPTKTVADGDQWVSIPFEATDTNGNNVKNYETIVRSTNTLTLNTGTGRFWIQENNDGTAALYWSDSMDAKTYTESSAFDGQDRSISLSAIVVNGEGSNIILSVSDMRRPTTVKKVKLNDDDSDALVNGNEANVDIIVTNDWDSAQVEYLDQYNEALDNGAAKAFFTQAAAGSLSRSYGVKVDIANNAATHLGLGSDRVYTGNNKTIHFNATADRVETDAVKYSVVESTNSSAAASDWDDAGKPLNVSYKVVPVTSLSGLSVKSIDRQQLVTAMSDKVNGSSITGSSIEVPAEGVEGELSIKNGATVGVTGTYASKTLTVPTGYYTVVTDATGAAFTVDGSNKITGIIDGAILWSELYDANSARYTRIDATKSISVQVYSSMETKTSDTLIGTPKTNVKISDGASVPTEVCFIQNYSGKLTSATVTPTYWDGSLNNGSGDYAYLSIKTPGFTKGLYSSEALAATVFDQYGNAMEKEDAEVEFAVSDIKENTDEFAHVPNSFQVSKNNSADIQITGAEIKDTFNLTATVSGTSVTNTIAVTVGADSLALLQDNWNADELLRKNALGYNR